MKKLIVLLGSLAFLTAPSVLVADQDEPVLEAPKKQEKAQAKKGEQQDGLLTRAAHRFGHPKAYRKSVCSQKHVAKNKKSEQKQEKCRKVKCDKEGCEKKCVCHDSLLTRAAHEIGHPKAYRKSVCSQKHVKKSKQSERKSEKCRKAQCDKEGCEKKCVCKDKAKCRKMKCSKASCEKRCICSKKMMESAEDKQPANIKRNRKLGEKGHGRYFAADKKEHKKRQVKSNKKHRGDDEKVCAPKKLCAEKSQWKKQRKEKKQEEKKGLPEKKRGRPSKKARAAQAELEAMESVQDVVE